MKTYYSEYINCKHRRIFIKRHFKRNYGCSIKDQGWEVINTPFNRYNCICMVICFNGSWIYLLTNQTLDSNRFIIFFEYFEDWLQNNKRFNYSEVLLIMDNCSIHKTDKIKNKINDKAIKLMNLPPYTPQ